MSSFALPHSFTMMCSLAMSLEQPSDPRLEAQKLGAKVTPLLSRSAQIFVVVMHSCFLELHLLPTHPPAALLLCHLCGAESQRYQRLQPAVEKAVAVS